MDVDEGFILGVYNYCDRWCAKCPFTSRCRVFADVATHEAMVNPDLRAVADALPHSSDIKEMPGWLEEVLANINAVALEDLPEPPPLPPGYRAVEHRARGLCFRVWKRLKSSGLDHQTDDDDPISIIQWFSTLIASKVYRAVTGLAEFDGCRDYPPDHEGSAKVALIGIDQSIAAWNDAVSIGRISSDVASEFVRDLQSLRAELEALIPKARRFVRPGFDEPEEVRRLESSDWA